MHLVEVPEAGEEQPVVSDDEHRRPQRPVAVAGIPLFDPVRDPPRAPVDDEALLDVADGIDIGGDLGELQGYAVQEAVSRVGERDAVAVGDGESLSGEGVHEVAGPVDREAYLG